MAHLRLWSACLALSIAATIFASDLRLSAQAAASRPNVAIAKVPHFTYDVWPADFNEDGITDFVAGRSDGPLVVALGDGDGGFPGEGVALDPGPLRPVVVGDFDGDGHIDILARVSASTASGIYAFRGRGDGGFERGASAVGMGNEIIGAQAADFDGDGNTDFALLETNRLVVFAGRGDLAFDTAAILATDPYAGAVIAADVDGQNGVDLAVATEDLGTVNLFMNQGDGGFDFALSTIPLEEGALGIAAADMNGDGALDLIVSTGEREALLRNFVSGHVYVLLQRDDGTFDGGQAIRYDTNVGPVTVAVGDFNGDGVGDIATGHLSWAAQCDSNQHLWDSVSILPGLAGGGLGTAATFALGNSEESPDDRWYRGAHHSLKTSDLNADGRTDLLAAPGATLLAIPVAANRHPIADAGGARNIVGVDVPYVLQGSAVDPDNDWLTFRWTDEAGTVIGTVPRPCVGHLYNDEGSQTFTLTVDDGRGGVGIDIVTYTFADWEPPSLLRESGDIGTVAAPGSSSFDGTTYTVAGSGADVWGRIDEFHYMYEVVEGPFELTARVTSVDNVHPWTKAGIMVRAQPTASSPHAFVFATPTAVNGVAFQRRVVTGAASVHTSGPAAAPPGWLRLRRAGNEVSAFHRRSEADPWTLIGRQTYDNLPAAVNVGLAVTSHADGRLATATFDNVSMESIADSWTSADVGAVAAPGSAWVTGSSSTVRGAGADIWGGADAFHYHYQDRTGDFEIAARVMSVENVNAWTKAGLMVRDRLDPGARHASLFVTPTVVKGLAFQRRPVANGWSVHTSGPKVVAPVWILLRRARNVISAYWSATGAENSWALIGWQEFDSLNATLQVGLAVSSHVPGTLATATFESLRLDDLPPWASVDVGAVGPAGTDASQPGQLSIEGAGADIWGSVDAFRFHQTPWSGDGTITVRVRSIENTHQWAKAGVMFREALQADAKHVMVIVSPGRGVAMQYRAQTGGLSANAALVAGAAPEWLRLTRRKGTFTGYASEDGITWRTLGSVKVPMYPDVHAGLAVTSHTTATLATAVFEGWQVRPEDPLPPGAFALTAPAQGSTLRGTAAAFAWQGSGDEFWLDIGSAPGRSDVYASGPLGQVSQHTVTGLPLNGMTLHVRVRRRVGAAVETVAAEYTAPIRKGLLVIADFADRTLETWQGDGFTSVADIRVRLLDMRNHWEWLSRGREQFRWDIIRVTLPEPAGPAAYPSWQAYREAVITLARQQAATADYDVNSDGVIDTTWIIVSNGDVPTGDYAIGGASRNADANTFVDGQASWSVLSEATGNFNHEVGHNLGLPDMYGTYGTLDTLTVMSFSWPVPPPDMAAWERLTLGWLEPRVVSQTTRDVWLPSANVEMAAVMVPTEHANEYFLIEYRTRPETGYGSATPAFNGLAVYHVLEGSWNSRNPPLVKLEPADGTVEYSQSMDLDNLVYPGNPHMVLPMVLRTYAGDEVFRLDNVEWRDSGLEFDVVLPAPVTGSQGLDAP